MPFTIFYAWQADRQPNLNRWFIEAAIKEAIKLLKAELAKEAAGLTLDPAPAVDQEEEGTDPDADPADSEIIYEWGAAGGTGTVLIGETILERITKCGVFIGDVSFVSEATTADGRKKLLPNSNVLIETGAAACTGRRWDRMVLVLNTAFGPVTELPFDLKHRSCRIQYELADPNDPKKARKRKQLAKELADQVQPLFRAALAQQDAENRQAEERATAHHAQQIEKAEGIHRDFETRLKKGDFYGVKAERPTLAVTVVPVSTPAQLLSLGESMMLKLIKFFQPLGISGLPPVPQRKSVVFVDQSSPQERATEVTADGRVFSALNLKPADERLLGITPKTNVSRPWPLFMDWYQPWLLTATQKFLLGLKELGVEGPWFFGLSLLKMTNGVLLPHRDCSGRGVVPFSGEDMRSDIAMIPANQDLSDPNALYIPLKPPLKEIWRQSGYPNLPVIKPDGTFKWIE